MNNSLNYNKMKKYFRNTLTALLGAVMFCVTSCKEDKEEDLRSKACDITAFTAGGEAWSISGTNITKTFPNGTDVTALTPTITVSEGATVSPASGAAQNFSQDVTYTVTAEDGTTTKTYTAKATVAPPEASNACDITAFTAGGESWSISGTNITGTLPAGTEVSALMPTITVSAGATVSPASGAAQDFSSADGVVYTVTAADGTTKKTYTAKATVTASTEAEIKTFTTGEDAWVIDGTDITKTFPYGTDVTKLTPTITVSTGATVSPASGEEKDFSQDVTYTVTAEDGVTTKEYTVKATIAPEGQSSACDITWFDVNGADWTIDDAGRKISKEYTALDAEVWWDPQQGPSLHGFSPNIRVSEGATVDPNPSEPQDFFTAEGVDYTVTAADGTTTKTYTVKAWIKQAAAPSGVRASKTGWEAASRNGNHDWSDLGACGSVPNPTQEHCGEGNHAGGEASRVLDENVWTGWHSNPSAYLPQAITIDMKESKRVSTLVLHHRPDALGLEHPSWIYFYTIQVYIGNDPYDPNTGDLAAYGSGIFTYTWDGAIPATINLPQTTEGQYLMLVFPDSKVEQYISFTELDVYVAE
jgi:hypothetical protein